MHIERTPTCLENLSNQSWHGISFFAPGISTIVAVADIIIKTTVLPCLSEETINRYRYLKELEMLDYKHLFLALIPVIGNIVLGILACPDICPCNEANPRSDSAEPASEIMEDLSVNKVGSRNYFDVPHDQVMVDAEETDSNQSKEIPPSDAIVFDDSEDSTKVAVRAGENPYINADPMQRQAMRKAIYAKFFPIVLQKHSDDGWMLQGKDDFNIQVYTSETQLKIYSDYLFLITLDAEGNSKFVKIYDDLKTRSCSFTNEKLDNVGMADGLYGQLENGRLIVKDNKPLSEVSKLKSTEDTDTDFRVKVELTTVLENNCEIMQILYNFNISHDPVRVDAKETDSNQSKEISPNDAIAFDDSEDSTKVAVRATESLSINNANPEQRQAMRKAIYAKLFPIALQKHPNVWLILGEDNLRIQVYALETKLQIFVTSSTFSIFLDADGNSTCSKAYDSLNGRICRIINEDLTHLEMTDGLYVQDEKGRLIVKDKKPELSKIGYTGIRCIVDLTTILEDNYKVMQILYNSAKTVK